MLTIVIPAYNHERYVVEGLAAACAVDLPGTEIIIVDDGSTDSTKLKIEQFLNEKTPRNVNFVVKDNSGVVSSLTLGLEMAKTEFIYFVASDDVLCPAGLAECVQKLKDHPLAMFCIGGGVSFATEDPEVHTPVYNKSHENFFSMSASSRADALYLDYPQPILIQSTVFRSAGLREVGGWDQRVILDDYPMFIKMLTRFPLLNRDFLYEPEQIVVKYRQHGANAFKNIPRQFFIIKQMLNFSAPAKIYSKALGKVLAMHFLGAVRLGRIADGVDLFRGSSIGVKLYFFYYFLTYSFSFFRRRLTKLVRRIFS
ncbi:glycosyltransferase family 2 protein [Pseudomonas sp. ADAK18]|uniref:glycosyltransferase family 2 protein n=1 Tax=Pseudomonas sp. ADAK18 TaxID=2730848 RepID=UPI001462E78C|nr:glycosyltransferase family 2 protein [Pseudomonas sp. ADAK18]QJI28192.1 glycosyltransferase family 2 protein [Pseudomonas sp. ADAK18]